VAWEDTRNGNPDIYAARVRTDGVLLDAGGIPVATGSAEQVEPAVGQSGSNALVAWEAGGRIRARRLTAEGTFLGSGAIVVSELGGAPSSPAIAWNGTDSLVVWGVLLSSGHGRQVRAARVSAPGTVRDAPNVLVADLPGLAVPEPDVVWTGSAFIVVFDHGTATTSGDSTSDVSGARVDGDGVLLDDPYFEIAHDAATRESHPTLALRGSVLVAWREDRSIGSIVGAARLDASGRLIDVGGFDVATASPDVVEPDAAAASGGWTLLYHRTDGAEEVFLRTVSAK
jgi:hypothetical protein